MITRFEQEVQVTAHLESPHTVDLHDFGIGDDGTLFYVMELLEGIDLDSMIRRFGPMPAERVVYVLRQVCASLAEAHQRALVHRDIKPANIVLCQHGLECDFVKVLDFGLVKRLPRLDGADGANVSRSNVVLGPPAFLAPEVEKPASADALAKRLDAISFATPWTRERANQWWAEHRPAGGDGLRESR